MSPVGFVGKVGFQPGLYCIIGYTDFTHQRYIPYCKATYYACADHIGRNVCGHLQWKIATDVHVVPCPISIAYRPKRRSTCSSRWTVKVVTMKNMN